MTILSPIQTWPQNTAPTDGLRPHDSFAPSIQGGVIGGVIGVVLIIVIFAVIACWAWTIKNKSHGKLHVQYTCTYIHTHLYFIWSYKMVALPSRLFHYIFCSHHSVL